jgi:uncharacterized DUF497 family protein
MDWMVWIVKTALLMHFVINCARIVVNTGGRQSKCVTNLIGILLRQDRISKNKSKLRACCQNFSRSICHINIRREAQRSEDRWITIGSEANEVLLVVVHAFRNIDTENSLIRVISARKATKEEAQQYHERR